MTEFEREYDGGAVDVESDDATETTTVDQSEDSNGVFDVRDEAPEEAVERPTPAKKDNRNSFVIHTYSGYENKVKANLERRIHSMGMQDKIFRVLVPMEDEVEFKDGKRKITPKKVFPGYVLVKMEMTDEAYHLIKNTPKVTGFLGSDNKPMPLSEVEAQRLLQQVQEGIERPKPSVTFEVGEQVRVSDGPFASFNGTVEEVDEGRSRVKVAVSIFGRATPVELEFGQVEKL